MKGILFRITMTVAAFAVATVMSFAQPEHNDTLRTKTWSIYVQGGVGGFHGMRGPENQYDRDVREMAPTVDFGFMYYPRPWLRFGLDLGYTYLKSSERSILKRSTTYPSVTIGEYTGTLTVDEARIQNQNFTNVAFTDLTLGINFVEIWRERETQWFNIWLSVGAGYMHGWNRYTSSWAIDENLVSEGPEHFNVYSHSYVESSDVDNQFNTLYIPGSLSVEFDVIPQLTLGVIGQYKYFPLIMDHTPTGMWTAGVVLRYNIVGRKQGFKNKNDKMDALRSDVAFYSAQLAEIEEKNEALNSQVSSLKKAVEDCQTAKIEVPVPSVEIDEPQGNFGVQIYAFEQYQHAPNEAIFHGDNPTIFRDGKYKKYVVFTQSYSEAKKQFESLKLRYPDAFIVKIEDDGRVISYK